MIRTGYTTLKKKYGISYLGNSKHSAKVMKSYENGTLTYCIYLAPADMSGTNVCPNSQHCKDKCLNASGHNRMDILKRGFEGSHINRSRIKKTRMFFDNRDDFMRICVGEIQCHRNKAEKQGMKFAVRINGTSDLNLRLFKYEGKTLFEIFPDVQFYDYTKVPARITEYVNHPNYDLTFSYDGHNWETCEKYLKLGGRVAVVFSSHNHPKEWRGYKVINGDNTDTRFLDPKGCIVGLTYHHTAKDVIKGHFVTPDDPFIVKVD